MSPIEEAMREALVANFAIRSAREPGMLYDFTESDDLAVGRVRGGQLFIESPDGIDFFEIGEFVEYGVIPGSNGPWSLFAGVVIGAYKLDFLLQIAGRSFAIECDGHDWHDRTKQQASSDRARDRELLRSAGIVTLRFTGSDIHRDAYGCALDALLTAKATLKPVRRDDVDGLLAGMVG